MKVRRMGKKSDDEGIYGDEMEEAETVCWKS